MQRVPRASRSWARRSASTRRCQRTRSQSRPASRCQRLPRPTGTPTASCCPAVGRFRRSTSVRTTPWRRPTSAAVMDGRTGPASVGRDVGVLPLRPPGRTRSSQLADADHLAGRLNELVGRPGPYGPPGSGGRLPILRPPRRSTATHAGVLVTPLTRSRLTKAARTNSWRSGTGNRSRNAASSASIWAQILDTVGWQRPSTPQQSCARSRAALVAVAIQLPAQPRQSFRWDP
jgi:hypothetical protein